MDVVILKCGPNKLNVVKLVREHTGLGNIEAMALVNNVPKPVKEGINKEAAEVIKKAFEGAGAEIEIIGIDSDSGLDRIEKKENFDDFE